MMLDLQSIAADVKPLVLSAGEIILNAWKGNHFVSHLKDVRDIVTDTDTEVEEYLRKGLYTVLPQAGFIVEEGKTDMQSEYNWAIDPIDGTKYFAKQAPLFYTQVALLRGSEPIVSFVYSPISNQLFHAIKDNGSYLNNALIKKTNNLPISSSIVDFDFGPVAGEENAWKYEIFRKISQKCYRVRATAGYFVPYLPLGVIDIYINTDIKTPLSSKNTVDLAPHKLLLTEAGYEEERLEFEGHSFLIWASRKHIQDIKILLEGVTRNCP